MIVDGSTDWPGDVAEGVTTEVKTCVDGGFDDAVRVDVTSCGVEEGGSEDGEGEDEGSSDDEGMDTGVELDTGGSEVGGTAEEDSVRDGVGDGVGEGDEGSSEGVAEGATEDSVGLRTLGDGLGETKKEDVLEVALDMAAVETRRCQAAMR
jgi:hypothetical protein